MKKRANSTISKVLDILRELHATYPNQTLATHIVLACGDLDCMSDLALLSNLEAYKACKDMDTSIEEDMDYFTDIPDEDSYQPDDDSY
jgi:hypothetical protein